MRRFREIRRGLAEIVGTLMLVVIVVAAATAFSFFVADYEKQVLAEENQAHLVSEEKVRITGISNLTSPLHVAPWSTFLGENHLNVTLVSADVNPMTFTAYEVDGSYVPGWIWTPSDHAPVACPLPDNNASNNASNFPDCETIAPYGLVVVSLPFNGTQGPIHLSVETYLGNDFSFLFFPPVPIITIPLLNVGTSTVPDLDGSGSYEPTGGDNASLEDFNWSVVPVPSSARGTVNVSGSQNSTSTSFTPISVGSPRSCPGGPEVTFQETGLPRGTERWVYVNDTPSVMASSAIAAVGSRTSAPPVMPCSGDSVWANHVAGYVVDPNTSCPATQGEQLGTAPETDCFNSIPATYQVVFSEKNLPTLPNDTTWGWSLLVSGVESNGTPYGGFSRAWVNASSVTLNLTNGTYSYVEKASTAWFAGEQVEVQALQETTAAITYDVTLTVTNTDGLTGTASVVYRS